MHPLDAYFLPLVHDAAPALAAHDDLLGSPALLAALGSVSDAVLVVDRDFRLVFLNDQDATMLCRPRADLLGTVAWEAYPALRGTPFEQEYRRAMATREAVAFEARYPGSGAWLAVRAHPSDVGLVIYCQDITSRKAIEAEIRFQEHLLNQVEVAVIATDVDGQITHWNAHATHLYGWSPAEALGLSVAALTVGEHDPAVSSATWARLRAGVSWSGEFQARRKDGTTFPAHITDAPVRDPEGGLVGIVGVSQDITERKAYETRLAHRASHDALTGLPNRAHFLDQLARCLADGARTCAVLFLDLDHFKPINDHYGHDVGDRLLVAVARRLVLSG
jgi:PAS domain S-box-containing protein